MLKVAQCWDDGVATDVRLIELLRKYNAKATFNLCPGAMKYHRVEPKWYPDKKIGCNGFHGGSVSMRELKELYGDFQVASHCWRHETATWVPDEDFINGAVDARNFLEDTFQKECRGFAWPCGQSSPAMEEALREAGFAYARTIGKTENVLSCTNLMQFHPTCKFADRDFVQRYENSKKFGAFYFWGHSYEMTDEENLWQDYEAKLKMIAEDPEAEWVDVIDLANICKIK